MPRRSGFPTFPKYIQSVTTYAENFHTDHHAEQKRTAMTNTVVETGYRVQGPITALLYIT
ncbi:hypothetical protein AC578_8917 [Pseudocercospora eumusae]|uniref:Uncharacterized protein n=1 Tax=Pseudocercospora eumusae TaxID=321146 RepID=A0A139HN19_9PEZI|nr:hypothetical protein AC578_8917 [Pseudocercospora eumusae]